MGNGQRTIRAVNSCVECDSSWEVFVTPESGHGHVEDASYSIVDGDVECPDCGSLSTELLEVDE